MGQAADTKPDEFPMKIKYALMSSNSDPKYLDFWPAAAEAWQKLGITPALFYIPDHAADAPVVPQEVAGTEVHTVPLLPDVHIVMQASLLRYWGSCKYPNDVVIISDIDLLPLSRQFFIEQLVEVADDRYVHLKFDNARYKHFYLCDAAAGARHDATRIRYLPACYHIAKGGLMHAVWWGSDVADSSGETGSAPSDWKSCCERVLPYFRRREGEDMKHTFAPKTDTAQESGNGIFNRFGDELYSSARVHRFAHQEVFHYVTYPAQQYYFLNRNAWMYDPERLRQGYYSAAHLPRPYGQYKSAIDALRRRRAPPLIYRALFWTIKAFGAAGRRSPKPVAFLFYFAIAAGEDAFGAIDRRTGSGGAALLQEHCKGMCQAHADNPRMVAAQKRYRRLQEALRRLLPRPRP